MRTRQINSQDAHSARLVVFRVEAGVNHGGDAHSEVRVAGEIGETGALRVLQNAPLVC